MRCSRRPESSAAGFTRSRMFWVRYRSPRIRGPKRALAEIWNAEDRRHALDAVRAFEAAYGAKFPKATAKITDDLEQLLAFYDYCAMRRSVISPVQRGEMGGISLDPMAYPAPKGNTGTIAC